MIRVADAPLPRAALVQMIVGAAAISTTSLFVEVAHVGPTMSAFYRMAFGGLLAWKASEAVTATPWARAVAASSREVQ